MRIERGCPENAKNEVFSFKSPAAGENFGILCFEYLRIPPLKCPKIFLRGGIVNWNTPDIKCCWLYRSLYHGVVPSQQPEC